MPTLAYAHLAVTVSDLERSVPWYTKLFDAEPIADAQAPGYRFVVWAQPSFALHHFAEHTDEPFDEHRNGLDHIAFHCADRSELEGWGVRLDELGIAHSEILDEWYGSGLSFRDPDNIALELFAPRPRPTQLR